MMNYCSVIMKHVHSFFCTTQTAKVVQDQFGATRIFCDTYYCPTIICFKIFVVWRKSDHSGTFDFGLSNTKIINS